MLVADIEELERMDASEIHARRRNAKEVLTPMRGANFIFPVADGTVKIFGGDRRLKQGSSLNEERNRKLFEENQTNSLLQPLFKMTLHGIMRQLKMISGLLREISFIAITLVELYMPREESFLIPLKYVDITRTTRT